MFGKLLDVIGMLFGHLTYRMMVSKFGISFSRVFFFQVNGEPCPTSGVYLPLIWLKSGNSICPIPAAFRLVGCKGSCPENPSDLRPFEEP